MRRIGAALLVGVGVLLGLLAVMPRPAATMTVAARALPAGHVLTPADLRTSGIAESDVPEGAVALDAAPGRRLARPLTAREPVTESALNSSRALAATERAVHVPVADPGALLTVHAGDTVDLVEAGGGRVVAPGARVVSVDPFGDDAAGHGLVVAVPAGALTTLVPAMSASGPGVTPALRPAP